MVIISCMFLQEIENTFSLVHHLIEDNHIELDNIDKIILAGGSCLSPTVKELIGGEFELGIEDSIDPLTVVARGAAIYAGGLKKPQSNLEIDSVALILSKNGKELSGRLFALDDKFSFLGFDIEFANPKSNFRIPVGLDGSFKVVLDEDSYDINVYNGDELIEIDVKSPNKVMSDEIYIPFFERCFTFSENIVREYDDLINAVEYLNGYGRFNDWDILNYAEKLSKMGNNSANQRNIYMNHLNDIVSVNLNDLEFTVLLENVQNKINILN